MNEQQIAGLRYRRNWELLRALADLLEQGETDLLIEEEHGVPDGTVQGVNVSFGTWLPYELFRETMLEPAPASV